MHRGVISGDNRRYVISAEMIENMTEKLQNLLLQQGQALL